MNEHCGEQSTRGPCAPTGPRRGLWNCRCLSGSSRVLGVGLSARKVPSLTARRSVRSFTPSSSASNARSVMCPLYRPHVSGMTTSYVQSASARADGGSPDHWFLRRSGEPLEAQSKPVGVRAVLFAAGLEDSSAVEALQTLAEHWSVSLVSQPAAQV